MIDLDGNYPGLIYLLGGTSIGSAWYLSGYPGSSNYAKKIYSFEKCENLAKSWLLISIDNKKEKINDLMERLNSEFFINYSQIGTFNYLVKNSTTSEQLSEITLALYKPKKVYNIINSCNNLKKKY